MRLFLIALSLFLVSAMSVADEAQSLEDPIFEERFRALASELRCQKCQNQSIYDSKAGLADDLKRQIKTQMHAGKTDDEIVDYMVARYGDFIRYKPVLDGRTMLLWVGPFILMALGAGILIYQMKKRRRLVVDAPLSDEDRRQVQSIIQNQGGDK